MRAETVAARQPVRGEDAGRDVAVRLRWRQPKEGAVVGPTRVRQDRSAGKGAYAVAGAGLAVLLLLAACDPIPAEVYLQNETPSTVVVRESVGERWVDLATLSPGDIATPLLAPDTLDADECTIGGVAVFTLDGRLIKRLGHVCIHTTYIIRVPGAGSPAATVESGSSGP
jgi:hypothetical protein